MLETLDKTEAFALTQELRWRATLRLAPPRWRRATLSALSAPTTIVIW